MRFFRSFLLLRQPLVRSLSTASGGNAGAAASAAASKNILLCADKIRNEDPLQFACLGLLPSGYKEPAAVLWALSLEMEQIPAKASNSNAIGMRLHWWRNAFEKAFDGSPPQHPIVAGLCEISKKYEFSSQPFYDALEELDKEADRQQPQNLKDLFLYLQTVSFLPTLVSLHPDAKNSLDVAHATAHVVTAVGLMKAIRNIPSLAASRQKTMIPKELHDASKLNFSSVIKRQPTDNLQHCVEALVSEAIDQLKLARDLRGKSGFPKSVSPFLLSANIADVLIKQISDVGFNVFNEELSHLPRGSLMWKLATHKLKGTF